MSTVLPREAATAGPSELAPDRAVVAYFSMEIAVDSAVPTYSGGLGVLAGDTLRSAADLEFPMVGVTLLYRQGYFEQHLDESGRQSEVPEQWSPAKHMKLLDAGCQ